MSGSGYVGRFAPSPTGRLHIGSLLAAVASWCDARHHGGQWLVRMEDLDPPREVPGAADDILRTLESFGFEWDGETVKQSLRHDKYEDALKFLQSSGMAFGCGCSRRDLQGAAVYPGTCRGGIPSGKQERLQRFLLGKGVESWNDLILGRLEFRREELGDFPILRADGFWAYQLAVVVDDRDQGITHVVRGSDLLDSTPRQLAIWKALQGDMGPEIPEYGHLPVLTNSLGQKLSKQTMARAVDASSACEQIDFVWRCLGQNAEDQAWRDLMKAGHAHDLLRRGAELWSRNRVPRQSMPLQGWAQEDAV